MQFRVIHWLEISCNHRGEDIRHFSKLRKLANWQLADCYRHINCEHEGPKAEFQMVVLRHHSFLLKAQNISTDKQL